jgi:cellulose synthase/poly-beta-1,6-N-acetylglucosamine synthase-like glycosyltransferase
MSFAKVSILIAARNEEQDLPVLLESLVQLSYPKEYLEILIGNDASSDYTAKLIEDFAVNFEHIRIINLEERTPEDLYGKTRVLDKLTKSATGDFYFFTDADIRLPRGWIESMLSNFKENTGVVVGVTAMKPTSFIDAMQGIEWLAALHLMFILSKISIKSTGMGNNMAVRKEAYWATGGYSKIPFSIVEDYALYKAIIDKGYSFKQAFEPQVLANTLPPERFFEQRKRWLKGAFKSGSLLLLPALLQAFFLPIFLLLFYWKIKIALFVFLGLLVFHIINVAVIERKLKINGYLIYTPLFVFYLPVAWFLQLATYLLNRKVVWKNRTY